MVKNYYEILGVKRDASDPQIANAYKKLSLRWHPKLSKQDQKTSFYHFCELSEAYEVLSDQVKRAFYDKFGEKKLKDGFFAEGELKGGYRFANNPDQIFEKFFTDNNVLAKVFDNGLDSQGSMFGYAFGGQNYEQTQGSKDLQVQIHCSLTQLYNGCSYPTSFKRTVVNLDGRTTSEVQIQKQIQIKPGSSCNSIIQYQNQGHETPGTRLKSKLIFKIVQDNHPKFKRIGDDLIYTADISLIDALNSSSIEIRTLDNRQLLVPFDQIINPKTVKQIQGEGMTIQQKEFISTQNYGNAISKGNLYIKFNILFPKTISQQQKIRLRKVLP